MNKVQYSRYRKTRGKAGYHMDLKARVNGNKNLFVKKLDNGNFVSILMGEIVKMKLKQVKKNLGVQRDK